MHMRRFIGFILAAIVSLASPALAEYPDKTIRIVVPYPPGGSSDCCWSATIIRSSSRSRCSPS